MVDCDVNDVRRWLPSGSGTLTIVAEKWQAQLQWELPRSEPIESLEEYPFQLGSECSFEVPAPSPSRSHSQQTPAHSSNRTRQSIVDSKINFSTLCIILNCMTICLANEFHDSRNVIARFPMNNLQPRRNYSHWLRSAVDFPIARNRIVPLKQ